MKDNMNFLSRIPNTQFYERSYSHKDRILNIFSYPLLNNVVSVSVDGTIKIWIEENETFREQCEYILHKKKIDMAKDLEGRQKIITYSKNENLIHVFDIKLQVIEKTFNLNHKIIDFFILMDKDRYDIIYLNQKHQIIKDQFQKEDIKFGVAAYSHNLLITLNKNLFIDYWDLNEFQIPTKEKNRISFSNKFQTDLFFLKNNNINQIIMMKMLVNYFYFMTSDMQLIFYDITSAKITFQINIRVENLILRFNKLMKVKQDINREKQWIDNLKNHPLSFQIQEFNQHLFIPSCLGILVYSISDDNIKLHLLQKERELFCSIILYIGIQDKLKNVTTFTGICENKVYGNSFILLQAFKSSKMIIMSNKEPFNKNTRDFISSKDALQLKNQQKINQHDIDLKQKAVISTTLGDIYIQFFYQIAPKAVENFLTHSKNGYYVNCIFHRVVKGYIQTGDPNNDGTGGESIWGQDFEDEISPELTHKKSFLLSMANNGPNSNGSQFFITTMPSPWLDGNHTIFAEVYKGTDVVKAIESQKTDHLEKPLEDIRILSINII